MYLANLYQDFAPKTQYLDYSQQCLSDTELQTVNTRYFVIPS